MRCSTLCVVFSSPQPTSEAPEKSSAQNLQIAVTDSRSCTGHNRLAKVLQHLVAHIKESEPPQEAVSALSLPVDSLCAVFPVQTVVKVDSKAYAALQRLLTKNGDGI